MGLLWMEIKYVKSAARLLDRDGVNKGGLDTVLTLFEPHSWIKPHPPKNQAKLQFLCHFYVVIRGQKNVLKNRIPGFK